MIALHPALREFLLAVNIVTFALTVFPPLTEGRWVEIFSYFRPQLLVASLLLLLLFAVMKSVKPALFALVTAFLNASVLIPWYVPPEKSEGETRLPSLRFMVANVLATNTRTEEVIQTIQAEAPSILVVLELTSRWDEALEALRPLLPHKVSRYRKDGFGIAVLSVHQLSHVRVGPLSPHEPPSIIATASTMTGPITVVATHTLPPIRPSSFYRRNAQLLSIASAAKKISGTKAILGDLNAPMWASSYRLLLRDARLRDSRQGFGILATWSGPLGLFSLPIDHCLLSDNFEVLDVWVKRLPGSDHKALVVDALPIFK